jgi:hypothetical protein
MTVEPSYRIDKEQDCVECDVALSRLQNHHVRLIPDSRLQAIADAPRCEHDMIDRHITHVEAAVTKWCEGAPELRDLLDALTEEER